jgi:hypothetical protein
LAFFFFKYYEFGKNAKMRYLAPAAIKLFPIFIIYIPRILALFEHFDYKNIMAKIVELKSVKPNYCPKKSPKSPEKIIIVFLVTLN